jgi:hypothetical protein
MVIAFLGIMAWSEMVITSLDKLRLIRGNSSKGKLFSQNLNVSNTYLNVINLEMKNTPNTTYLNNIMIVNKII